MPLGGAENPTFRGAGRGARWLASATMLAVLLPLLAVGGIILSHILEPMSGFDRALFCASGAAVVSSTVATYRMRLTSSWCITFLLCAPVALSLYPITHSVASSALGVVIPVLFRWLDGEKAGQSP